MACDPQTLIEGARCFQCFGNGTLFDAMEVVLLCAIADGDTSMACDPQTLISQANCLMCNVPPGMWAAIKIYLLCQIASGGGGGGSAALCGAVDPVAAPSGTCAFYFNTAAHSFWAWNGAAWEALIV